MAVERRDCTVIAWRLNADCVATARWIHGGGVSRTRKDNKRSHTERKRVSGTLHRRFHRTPAVFDSEKDSEKHNMWIYYLYTLAAVLMETEKNILSNGFSKKAMKNNTDVYKFNTVMYSGSLIVLLGILAVKGIRVSLYSLGMAILFAAVSGEMQASFLRALRRGPLSYINYIQTSGLVIPALFGAVFLSQPITALQLAALPFLFISMALVLNLRRGERSTGKWLADALISMLCCGLVGVVQSMHQASDHADEINSFLALTFIFIVISNLIPWRISERKEPASFSIREKEVIYPLLSGLLMGVVNVVNLYLIRVMPTVVYFPLANGGLLIMTMLAAVVFFKEKLNLRQWVGIVIGMISMYMLGK